MPLDLRDDETDTCLNPEAGVKSQVLWDRWKNRRRMAWISLYAMLAVTAFAMSPYLELARLEKLETVITWFYMSCASVVGSYMAVSTWAAINGVKPKIPEEGSDA